MPNTFPRTELTADYTISRVIKGGWQLAAGHGPSRDTRQAIEDMRAFVVAGMTTFDCADIYTGVEQLIGQFLKQYRGAMAAGDLPAVQVHTKCVPDLEALPNINKAHTAALIERSLTRLGVERLDLVQFHWWDLDIPGYLDLAQHLAELQQEGKIRHIGVTNFDARRLKAILDTGIRVVSNQVQYSVLDHRPEGPMGDLCRQHHIQLLCYGSVAGGFLTERYLGVPEPREPLSNRSLTKYKLIIDEFGGWELFQELLACLKAIGRSHGVGIAEVAIQYVLQKPHVAAAIVGARNSNHLAKIEALQTLQLEQDQLGAIETVIAKSQGPRGPIYALERDKDGRHAKIMKYNQNKA